MAVERFGKHLIHRFIFLPVYRSSIFRALRFPSTLTVQSEFRSFSRTICARTKSRRFNIHLLSINFWRWAGCDNTSIAFMSRNIQKVNDLKGMPEPNRRQQMVREKLRNSD